LTRGYEIIGEDPEGALEDLLAEVPGLERSSQAAQLEALTSGRAYSLDGSQATPKLDEDAVARWRRWAQEAGLLER
jgi:hypothetical protein